MKALLLVLALLTLLPARGRAESAVPSGVAVSQDPLAEQIRRRELVEPNGGITAVVRLGSGQVIPLQIVNLDMQPLSGALPKTPADEKAALAALKPQSGLLPATRAASRRKGKPVKAADKQLRHIQKNSWSDAGSHASAL